MYANSKPDNTALLRTRYQSHLIIDQTFQNQDRLLFADPIFTQGNLLSILFRLTNYLTDSFFISVSSS